MQLNAIYLGMPHLRLPQKLLLTMNSALGRINETDKRKWIMRINLTTFLLIIALAQVYAKGFGQKITLNESNAPLEKVLKSIRQQSGYEFIYDVNDLKGQKISINLSNASVEDAVRESIRDLPLAFKIVQRNIVLTRIEPSFLERIIDRFNAIDVRGVVVDSAGNPLQGATVKVKGSNTQVTTSSKGEFYIANVDENAVLVVSYVGYVSKEIKAEKDLGMIRMVMASADLEEVNIASTGYQKVKPNEVTGSLVVIDNKTLNQQVGTNILKRLNGVTSGMLFEVGKNNPQRAQSNLNISIRGLSTINGPLDPLIVLDGFIYEGDISNLNPNDIDNITILKDAAAASIWGARAGNGVIVMTTKSGKYNRQLSVSLNSNVLINAKPDLSVLPQMSASDYIDVEEQLFNNGYDFNGAIFSDYQALTPAVEIFLKRKMGKISRADSAMQINSLKETDGRDQYSDYVYKNAITQQYAVNINGGGKNNAYLASVGYDRNTGELQNTFEKINVRFRNTFSINPNLQVSIGAYYTKSEGQSGLAGYNSISFSGRQVPYLKIADQNGVPLSVANLYQNSYTDTAGAGKLLNWKYYPLDDYKNEKVKSNLNELFSNMGVDYKFNKMFDLNVSYQYQRQQTETEQFSNEESFTARNMVNLFSQLDRGTSTVNYIVPPGGIRNLNNSIIESQTGRAQVNFHHVITDHEITAITGAEARQIKGMGDNYTAYGYYADPLAFSNVDFVNAYPTFITGAFQNIPGAASFSHTVNRFLSVYANASYSYKKRYLLSISGRRDGSNVFGANTNDKWKPLWSVGGAWRISDETFYNSAFLPFLKLKITYGLSGNIDPTKTAAAVATLFSGNTFNLPYVRIQQLNNPNLRWEQTGMMNVGADFALKKNIVSGSVEFYTKNGTDLYGNALYDYTAWGYTNELTRNVANMKGYGVDVNLNSKIIDRTFKWGAGILFNYNINKTTKYESVAAGRVNSILGGGGSISPVVGKPLYAIAAYQWAGLDESGNPQGYVNGQLSTDYVAIKNEAGIKGVAGNIKYIGSTSPEYFGSLINEFGYKGFTISASLNYKFGYYFRRPVFSSAGLVNGIGHSDYTKRWQNQGDETKTTVPAFVYPVDANRDNFYALAEINVLKADHVRLQYINLSYSFERIAKNINFFKQIEIYVNAANLGILWRANRESLDPEYPYAIRPSKSIAFGLRAGF